MSTSARTLSVEIRASVDEIVRFVADVDKMPLWATDFCRDVRGVPDEVEVLSPFGWVQLGVSVHLASGVVDLHVDGPTEVAGTYFTRSVDLGEGRSLFAFTWPRPAHLTWDEFDTNWTILERELDEFRRRVELASS